MGEAIANGGAFDGARDVIARAFSVTPKGISLRQLCKQLGGLPLPPADYVSLVKALYQSIEANCAKESTSKQNWRWCDPQIELADHNESKEVLLERAIAILTKKGHLPNWSNQIPVISGLVPGRQEKRAAVDLARLVDGRLELVELKWDSDSPIYAAFEITLYGLAYVFCRLHLPYGASEIMQASNVALNVLAPEDFYAGTELVGLERGLSVGFNALLRQELPSTAKGEFQLLRFRPGFKAAFEAAFKKGSHVKAACDRETLDAAGLALCDAINCREPVYA